MHPGWILRGTEGSVEFRVFKRDIHVFKYMSYIWKLNVTLTAQ